MRLPLAVLAPAVLLASCGGPPAEEQEAEAEVTPAELPAPADTPSPEQLTLLESRDCRTVARAYLDALATGDFAYAARFWDDPVIDDARLQALFAGYMQPTVEIAEVMEEGAAGSLYCTVTGALTDIADSSKAARQGQVVLRRANDVPGATEEQLRWTIRSSTFIEAMERSGRGDPA